MPVGTLLEVVVSAGVVPCVSIISVYDIRAVDVVPCKVEVVVALREVEVGAVAMISLVFLYLRYGLQPYLRWVLCCWQSGNYAKKYHK